jgi:hypothetical protein
MKKIIVCVCALLVMLVSNFNGQTLVSPTDVQLVMEPQTDVQLSESEADTLTDPFSMMDVNMVMNVSTVLTLLDTVNVSKIHVKIGRTSGLSDIVEHSFAFDDYSPGLDFSYERDENSIKIGVGGFADAEILYAEIYLEDVSGNRSLTTFVNTEE